MFILGQTKLICIWYEWGQEYPYFSTEWCRVNIIPFSVRSPRTPGKQGIETFKWLRPLIFSIKRTNAFAILIWMQTMNFIIEEPIPFWDLYSRDKHAETENTPFQFGLRYPFYGNKMQFSYLKFGLSEKHTNFEKNLPHGLDVWGRLCSSESLNYKEFLS